MNETKKILITVMTYPIISKKYDELVCTAGVQEDGSWIRIYPLPFHKLDDTNQFRKYQWIEVHVEKNRKDPRPESYNVVDRDNIKLLDIVDTSNNWSERKRILFNNQRIYTNLKELITKANSNKLSFAIFKPNIIDDFIWKKTDPTWPDAKLALLKAKSEQLSLFQTAEEIEKEFLVVPKLPYKFYYKFVDDAGTASKMMIEDWEVGKLYWDRLGGYNNKGGNSWQKKQNALCDVKHEYYYEYLKKDKDCYFLLGTLRRFQGWAKNPFVIVGTFCLPVNK